MKYIAIHHSAVVNNGTPQLYAVNRYHQQKWDMKSRLGWYVGYNYFIDVDGKVTQTRAWSEETIANKGHNCDVRERCDTISICLADNYDVSMDVAPKQDAALCKLIRDIKRYYKDIEVVGHRDLQEGRTCPGYYIGEVEFVMWNALAEPDSIDYEKEKKIKELQSQLDYLRNLLNSLLAKLR